jgi:hypothetical protein
MAKRVTYNFSDDAIAQVVKLLQMGILTGTDIVDNLRLLEFVTSNGKLEPSPEYLTAFDENLQKLQKTAEDAANIRQPGFKGLN